MFKKRLKKPLTLRLKRSLKKANGYRKKFSRGLRININNPIRKTKTTLYNTLNRARIKLEKAPINKAILKAHRNFTKRSFFGRFINRKTRRFKRTLDKPPGRFIDFPTASNTHYSIRTSRRNNMSVYKVFMRKGKPYKIRPFTLGLVTAILRRRNFFAAVHKINPSNLNATKLVFKSSVSLTGYRGTKRGTYLGRRRVGNAVGKFLRRIRFTTLDLVFPRRLNRHFKFFFKGLITYRFRVRRIHISKRRSHGTHRRRKPKRK